MMEVDIEEDEDCIFASFTSVGGQNEKLSPAYPCSCYVCRKRNTSNNTYYSQIPGRALKYNTRNRIAGYFDYDSCIPVDESGLTGDWRGLACCLGLANAAIQTLERHKRPTYELLNSWDKNLNANFVQLLDSFNRLNRCDVLLDISRQIEQDAHDFVEDLKPVQDAEVSGSADSLESAFDMRDEVLTVDDSEKEVTQLYDAFVCFAESNLSFVASQLVPKLEKHGNMKLFVGERDLLPGNSKYNAYARLISRCSRVIVVLSPAFVLSRECEWIVKYAQAMSMEEQQNKLVPVLIEDVRIPDVLKGITVIKLNKSLTLGIDEWQWKRLAAALRVHNSTIIRPKELTTTQLMTGRSDHCCNKSQSMIQGATSQSQGMVQGATSQSQGVLQGATSQSHNMIQGATSQSHGMIQGATSQSHDMTQGATSQSQRISGTNSTVAKKEKKCSVPQKRKLKLLFSHKRKIKST